MNPNQKCCQTPKPERCINFVKNENHLCYLHIKKFLNRIRDMVGNPSNWQKGPTRPRVELHLNEYDVNYIEHPYFKNDMETFIEKVIIKNNDDGLINVAKDLMRLKNHKIIAEKGGIKNVINDSSTK
jgi:hypothetical protein